MNKEHIQVLDRAKFLTLENCLRDPRDCIVQALNEGLMKRTNILDTLIIFDITYEEFINSLYTEYLQRI